MKRLTSVMALAVMIVFGAGPAFAAECPLLIKQINEALPDASDEGAAEDAQELVQEAQELHDTGKHAESVKKAEEAAALIGLELTRKK